MQSARESRLWLETETCGLAMQGDTKEEPD